jgi:hypothetical protein
MLINFHTVGVIERATDSLRSGAIIIGPGVGVTIDRHLNLISGRPITDETHSKSNNKLVVVEWDVGKGFLQKISSYVLT